MINRRDFLSFRVEPRRRCVEVSCERLYMRYLDAQAEFDNDSARAAFESWAEEPAAELRRRTVRDLFDDLARELEHADVVRLRGAEWLVADGFKRDFERAIAAFRERGGRVEQ